LSPELTRALRQLHLSLRDFANITGVHEDVVYSWDRKPASTGNRLRPQPGWVKPLIDAWLFDPSLLGKALADALIATQREAENAALTGPEQEPEPEPEQEPEAQS
jgi:hypothetical protein